jgi:signal transduction histidine kinase
MLEGMQRDEVGWEGRSEGVEEMLRRMRRAASTAFAQLRQIVAKFSCVSHSDLSLSLSLSLLADQGILLAKAWGLFVFHGQDKTILTESTYRFGLL